MNIFSIVILFVAVYVAKPAFTGKGSLMKIECIKKGKEKTAQKGLRISYLVIFFCSILLFASSLAQNSGFDCVGYHCRVDQDYSVDGTVKYKAGDEVFFTPEEYSALVPETTSSGTCAVASRENDSASLSCTSVEEYKAKSWTAWLPGETDNERYSFVSKVRTIVSALSLADVLFLLVFTNLLTDKAEKAKQQEKQAAAQVRKPHMPSAAFDFESYDGKEYDDQKGSDENGN